MPKPLRPLAIAALLACLASASARADAPLRTDNADVPDQGNCKVEAAYEGSSSEPNYVAQVACVPLGIVELSAAYARSRSPERIWGDGFALQAKVPIVPKDDDDDWFALAGEISTGRDAFAPGGGPQFAWINVPASFYLMNDRWRIHLNGGVLLRRTESDLVTWGAATEYDTGPVTWLAETYRIASGNGRWNLGARYEVGDGFAVYVSAGRMFGSDPGSWVVVAGIKLESPTALKWLGEKTASAGRALAMRAPATPAP